VAGDFARGFGDALAAFLNENKITEAAASRKMGMGRATLNTYTRDRKGKRTIANAEILAKACTSLGFELEYNGFKIAAYKDGAKVAASSDDQLQLEFTRELNLESDSTTVGLSKRPKRVELSISIKAVS
jgi:hypothetical protein